MSLSQYPPVAAPSVDQELLELAGAEIDDSAFLSFDFSPEFKEIYGAPTLYVHAWARLMDLSLQVPNNIMPVYSTNFINFCGRFGIKAFRDNIDEKCSRLGFQKLGRPLLEAAWARLLLRLFERDVERDITQILSWNEEENGTREDALEHRKKVLRSALETRFSRDMEEYWAQFTNAPGFDLTRVLDNDAAPAEPELLYDSHQDVEQTTEALRNIHLDENLGNDDIDIDIDDDDDDGDHDEDEDEMSTDEVDSIDMETEDSIAVESYIGGYDFEVREAIYYFRQEAEREARERRERRGF